MTTADGQAPAAKTIKKYFIAADVCTHEAIAVLEAEHEVEARQFFAAVRHLLLQTSDVNIHAMQGESPPHETPVFHREYLRVLQINAQEEHRAGGTVRH
jgi:hypothetical protein